jgi:quinoprotein dehydrogenase-associated probable ABC transporter substrate-binding protein
MSLVSKAFAPFILLGCTLSCAAAPQLRVCADPNNLPYSDRQQRGVENKLAQMVAKDLGTQVSYFWFPQQDAFFRKTLQSGRCDVVMAVPVGMGGVDTTRPYYRSSYVFVSRRAENLRILSFDDPRLRSLRIGIHVLDSGDDSLPPVYALASRGIVQNVSGYSIFGHSVTQANPTADLIDAIARNEVDVAIAWGPTAGYFARQSPVSLNVEPIEGDPAHPNLPFTFEIGIGVRKGEAALREKLDAEVARRHAEIARLLRSYGFPQLNLAAPPPRSIAEK